MTDFLSNHYVDPTTAAGTPTGTTDMTVSDPRIKVAPGISHARMYYKRAEIDLSAATLAAADIIRLFTLQSGDRIHELMLTTDGGGWALTALTVNVGLYDLLDGPDAGAVLDADIFASAVALATTSDRLDVLVESATVGGIDRGRPLWEVLALGAGSDTEDPFEQWDVGVAPVTVTGVTEGTLVGEVIYSSSGVN